VNVLRSFQGKLLIFFLLIDMATVGVLIVTASGTAREALEAQIREHLLDFAHHASQDLDEELQLRWDAAGSLAANPFMTNSVIDTLGRSDYLEPLMQRLSLPGRGGEDADLWLLDFMGRVIARNGRPQSQSEGPSSFAEAPWWPVVRDGASLARVVHEGGRSYVLFAFPVVYQRHIEGAVVTRFDLSFARGFSAREGFDSVLLAGTKLLLGSLPEPVLRELGSRSVRPGERTMIRIDDTFYLVVPVEGFAREHGFGWSLVLSVPAERIFAPVEQLRLQVLQVGGVTALLLALLVVWRTRVLLRPLRQLQRTMRRIIRGGNLGQRIEVRSDDELAAIARTFNQMLERLEHRTAELERSRETLVQSEKMAAMGTLVAGLSHELNNPLGIILGFTQGLLRRPSLDESSRLALSSIERQTQRCARLVRTLLDYAHKRVPVRERVDVGAMLERVGELASGPARRGEVRLEVVSPSETLPELEASVQELESALLNLVSNALDATPPRGRVSVSVHTSAEGEGLELRGSDTGRGMSPELLQRIFDPFFTTKSVGEGTGLGLSITRSIVESHGGRIKVESAPGEGTTMRLWLPVAVPPPRDRSKESVA